MKKRIGFVFLLMMILVLDFGTKSNAVYNKDVNDYNSSFGDIYSNELDEYTDYDIYESDNDNYYSDNDDEYYENHKEDILNYDIEIYVNKDASMYVKEKITVNARGYNINHGIYRDFPTKYRNKNVTFDVNKVLLNGNDVEYSTESVDRGIRVRIGSEHTYVPRGVQEYEIDYTTENQLFFEREYNELYWNLIGSGWLFDIEKCSAKIYFPEETEILNNDIKAYVGKYGDSNESEDVEWYVDKTNSVVYFNMNKTIERENAFTIVVRVNKGTITEPDLSKKVAWFAYDKIVYLMVILGFVGLGVWQFFAWRKHGNKINSKVIIPKYYPPEGMDVSQVRYLDTMGSKKRVLESIILSLATKGYVFFTKTTGKKKVMVIEKTGKKTTNEFEDELSDTEKFVYNSLAGREYLMYSKYFYELVENLKRDIFKDLEGKYKNSSFFKNWKYVIISVICTLLIFIVGLKIGKLINPFATSYNLKGLELVFTFVISFGILAACIKNFVFDPGRNLFTATFIIIMCIPFAFGEYQVVREIFRQYSKNFMDIFVIAWAVIQNWIFAKYIRCYSEKALKIKEDIEGFKMFIKTTEDESFVEKSPEMFDKYFAYAYALGLENKWAKKFEKILAKIDYAPTWCTRELYYNGNFDCSSFTSSFSSAFSSGMSAASTAPLSSNSSSSDGGSGGSSGGGGFSGGGGGGRWPEVAGKKIKNSIKLALSY